MYIGNIFTARNEVGARLYFHRRCHSVNGGGKLPGPGGYLVRGGSARRGGWSWGFCSGGVSALGGVCSMGGLPGSGGVPGGDPPDGHCCGRYASYWNAFLF